MPALYREKTELQRAAHVSRRCALDLNSRHPRRHQSAIPGRPVGYSSSARRKIPLWKKEMPSIGGSCEPETSVGFCARGGNSRVDYQPFSSDTQLVKGAIELRVPDVRRVKNLLSRYDMMWLDVARRSLALSIDTEPVSIRLHVKNAPAVLPKATHGLSQICTRRSARAIRLIAETLAAQIVQDLRATACPWPVRRRMIRRRGRRRGSRTEAAPGAAVGRRIGCSWSGKAGSAHRRGTETFGLPEPAHSGVPAGPLRGPLPRGIWRSRPREDLAIWPRGRMIAGRRASSRR